jgi:hypothetical protein
MADHTWVFEVGAYIAMVSLFCVGLMAYYLKDHDGVTENHYHQNFSTTSNAEAKVVTLNQKIAEESEAVAHLTDDEILSYMKDKFQTFDKVVDQTIKGKFRAVIVSGDPGLGKSFPVESALNEYDPEEKNWSIAKGYSTTTGVVTTLYKNRKPGQITVFDDIDSVFQNETTLNILKAALDTTKKRKISYLSQRRIQCEETGQNIKKTFTFEGTVIFITNKNFDEIIEKGGKNSEHLEAMLSRCFYMDLNMGTPRHKILRIKQVAETGKLFDPEITKEQAKDVLDFIEQYAHRFRELSLRAALKVANVRMTDDPTWKKMARDTCLKK